MFYCYGEYNINKPTNEIIYDLTWFSPVIIFKEMGNPTTLDDSNRIVKEYISLLVDDLTKNL